jgi:hypothetical protein
MNTAIFTICSNNYLASAKVLFDSARAFHPEASFFLVLADAVLPELDYPADVTILPAEALGIPDFRSVAFRYGIMEFNTAVKPFAFLNLFAKGYDKVIYFDPDIEIFSPLDSVAAALARGASFVLTPHLTEPAENDAPRTDIHVMQTGVFNLGFLACSRQFETDKILRWWARRLRYECVNDQSSGLFVDQKFMDLVPALTDHSVVLRDTTLNVAYWNLAQRSLEQGPQGWTVDGRPLGFFHFSGFDPSRPRELSHRSNVPDRYISPDLINLLALYADKLRAAGQEAASTLPYGYAKFTSGAPIPDTVRWMFRCRHITWAGDPFENYEAYLDSPCSGASRDSAAHMVTNLMKHVYDTSPSLQSRFDLREAGSVAAYAEWFTDHAHELGIDQMLVEPIRHRAQGTAVRVSSQARSG